MAQFTKDLASETGAYAECIEIGDGASSSIFEDFENQATEACTKLKANPHFANTKFNAVGLSQGSLLARYVVQLCDTKETAHNLLTIGSPSMGVEATPHCFKGIFCDIINYLVDNAVYFKIA
jgi:palmitoyl-protein thioesterase